MHIHLRGVLTPQEVTHCRAVMEAAPWIDGQATAGEQAGTVKANRQLATDSPQARELGEVVLRALGRNAIFNSAALPLRVMPPMFNRYDTGMRFGTHVDNCIRAVPGGRMRADVSSTLSFTDPDEYDGGELNVEDAQETRSVKLPAGDMILYPTVSLHSVSTVTRGTRWSSFFWTQSLVKDDGQRAILHELDMAIMQVRANLPDDDLGVLRLTNTYHKLLRQWSEL